MTRLGSFEKRPELLHLLTAAFGTKRTCLARRSVSAFGGKADMAQGWREVCF
jgi:hypothetical protein